MSLGIGINGAAGRIGKFAAYELVQLGATIVDMNDVASTDAIVDSLAKRDSVHGTLDWEVRKAGDDTIMINGDKVQIYHEKDPADILWGSNVVAECTGFFTAKDSAQKHFQNSPSLETVVISAPADVPTYVMGVNHADYCGESVISNASCTTKALAMPMKVLIDAGLEIYAVLMDTTHAATNTSKPLDTVAGYGLMDNIISAKTGAAIATSQVIPLLDGKMDGFAMRVPTRDGSFANVYFVAEAGNLSPEAINAYFILASAGDDYVKRIDTHDGKEIASTDIIGNTASSVIVTSKTKSMPLPLHPNEPENVVALIGIVSGYDNERGPAKDLALLCQYVAKHGK